MKEKDMVFDTVQFVNKIGAWRYCDICKRHMHQGDIFSTLYLKGKRVGCWGSRVDICSDCLEV